MKLVMAVLATATTMVSGCTAEVGCTYDDADFKPIRGLNLRITEPVSLSSQFLQTSLRHIGTCVSFDEEPDSSEHDLIFFEGRRAGTSTVMLFTARGVSDRTYAFIVDANGTVVQKYRL